jgi:hypothetical protein
MYNLVLDTITDMDIGSTNTIDTPDNLPYFRKYLSEISKREGKRFITKIIDGKLHVMRVKYSNIYSKEIE